MVNNTIIRCHGRSTVALGRPGQSSLKTEEIRPGPRSSGPALLKRTLLGTGASDCYAQFLLILNGLLVE
jgi:hypothetical protein